MKALLSGKGREELEKHGKLAGVLGGPEGRLCRRWLVWW
jgi:hypothetical protein